MAKPAQNQDRIATAKQFRAIIFKFAKQIQELENIQDIYWFRLWKQVQAVIASNNPKGVTSGQVSNWFSSDELPKYLIANLQLDFEEKGKNQKSKKTTAKPIAKKVSKKPAKKTIKVSEKPTTVSEKPTKTPKESPKFKELEARMTFIEGEVSEMSESIQTIKSGMESILAHLQG